VWESLLPADSSPGGCGDCPGELTPGATKNGPDGSARKGTGGEDTRPDASAGGHSHRGNALPDM